MTLRGSTHKLRRSVPSTSFSSWYCFSTGLEKALLGRHLTETNESVHQYKNLLTTQNPRIKGQKEAWHWEYCQCEMFWLLLWPCFGGTTEICPRINGIFISICLRRTKTKAAGMGQMVFTKIGHRVLFFHYSIHHQYYLYYLNLSSFNFNHTYFPCRDKIRE